MAAPIHFAVNPDISDPGLCAGDTAVCSRVQYPVVTNVATSYFKSHKVLIIGVIVCIIIVLMIYMYYSKKNVKKEDDSSAKKPDSSFIPDGVNREELQLLRNRRRLPTAAPAQTAAPVQVAATPVAAPAQSPVAATPVAATPVAATPVQTPVVAPQAPVTATPVAAATEWQQTSFVDDLDDLDAIE